MGLRICRGTAQQIVDGFCEKLRFRDALGKDTLSGERSKLEADVSLQKIISQPEKLAEFPVQTGCVSPQVHGYKDLTPDRFHGFPQDQLAGFCSELPMNLIQTVTGTV